MSENTQNTQEATGLISTTSKRPLWLRFKQKIRKPLVIFAIGLLTIITVHIVYAVSAPTYQEHLEADEKELSADWHNWNSEHAKADKRVVEAQGDALNAIEMKKAVEGKLVNVRGRLADFQTGENPSK